MKQARNSLAEICKFLQHQQEQGSTPDVMALLTQSSKLLESVSKANVMEGMT